MEDTQLPEMQHLRLPEEIQAKIRSLYPGCKSGYDGILLLFIAHLAPGLKPLMLSGLMQKAHFKHTPAAFSVLVEHLIQRNALKKESNAYYPTAKVDTDLLQEWMATPLLAELREDLKKVARRLIQEARTAEKLPGNITPVCKMLRLMNEDELAWELLKIRQTYQKADRYSPSTYELAQRFLSFREQTHHELHKLPRRLQDAFLPGYYFDHALHKLPTLVPHEWWGEHLPADEYELRDYVALILFIALQTGRWELLSSLEDIEYDVFFNKSGLAIHDLLSELYKWQGGKWSALGTLLNKLAGDRRSLDYFLKGNTDFLPLHALLSPLILIAFLKVKNIHPDNLHDISTWMLKLWGLKSKPFFNNAADARIADFRTEQISWQHSLPIDFLPKALALTKRDSLPAMAEKEAADMYQACINLWENGLGLYAFYMANALLCLPLYTEAQYDKLNTILNSRPDLPRFCKIATLSGTYDKFLEDLENLAKSTAEGAPIQPKRILWKLYAEPGTLCIKRFSALAQKKKSNGKYSPGQRIFIPNLMRGNYEDYRSEADDRFLDILRSEDSYYVWHCTYDAPVSVPTLSKLCGNPNIVLCKDAKETPIELVAIPPRLKLKKTKDKITLSVEGCREEDVQLHHLGENKYGIITPRREHEQFCKLIEEQSGKSQISFPLSYRDKLLERLYAFASSFELTGDIGSNSIKEQKAQYRAVVQMRGQDGALSGSLRLELFPGGPLVASGSGEKQFFVRQKNQTLLVHRSRPEEQEILQQLLNLCPTLAAELDAENNWLTPLNDTALSIVDELQACPPELLEVRWPEGAGLSIRKMQDYEAVSMSVSKSAADWLSIGGEVQVDEGKVVLLAELLRSLRESPGRYIKLDDTHFLRLSRNLERQLRTISALAQQPTGRGKKKQETLIPPATLLLLGQADGQEQLPNALHAPVQQLMQNYDTTPRLPHNLQASLRDYQTEGYRWMQRLMNCGLGACLADDMGLGKTLQVLSVLLARAADGPSLVVAPVSVCNNWVHEAARFTPTLNLSQLGTGDRQDSIHKLDKRDVLVCSYGLLVTERELLAGVKWNVVVLDEAQYIKNDLSRRAQAAVALSARCRIAATGTPIENSLAELRSIFDFLNPGLLGSREEFSRRFTSTPEQHKLLRRIVSPFILRRLKGDVLDELPPKTETTHYITLSEEERALYEATRRTALAEAQQSEDRFSILAQLMKLRRLCCHPQLALPESSLNSAKLEALLELADELRTAGHRALIFSQFTDMLAHVRAAFDTAGLSYCYLDGSTPQRKRAEEIQRFREGETDFFLISLKAGGTGLNLTSADYVILLDPWWNPAVEDQAADRAHRIGQQNPVTICRLVCTGTIEERVLKLHKDKRQLVDDVLNGEKKASPLSIKELTELI